MRKVKAKFGYSEKELVKQLNSSGIPLPEGEGLATGEPILLYVTLVLSPRIRKDVGVFEMVACNVYAKGAWTTVAVHERQLQDFLDQNLENGG